MISAANFEDAKQHQRTFPYTLLTNSFGGRRVAPKRKSIHSSSSGEDNCWIDFCTATKFYIIGDPKPPSLHSENSNTELVGTAQKGDLTTFIRSSLLTAYWKEITLVTLLDFKLKSEFPSDNRGGRSGSSMCSRGMPHSLSNAADAAAGGDLPFLCSGSCRGSMSSSSLCTECVCVAGGDWINYYVFVRKTISNAALNWLKPRVDDDPFHGLALSSTLEINETFLSFTVAGIVPV